VRLADAALYRAKANGPGDAAVFDAGAERTAACGAVFEDAFRRAVAESEVAVPFPPIVGLATGTAALNRLRA
jgi:predicted signal transduction protein with EAL and GGDEF domain